MAFFARICVLRGFPAAAYRAYAFLSRFVCGNRKPLCGLDPDKNCSFMNWKRNVAERSLSIGIQLRLPRWKMQDILQ